MSVVITVGATDAVGTKMVATTTATISTAVPVCTAVNFTIPTNPKASTVIGTIATTNSPTSSQIVSGNTNNYFAIGLHHTAVSGSPIPPDGIYSLMVDATNAAGTGPAVPVTITVGSAIRVGTASFNLGFPVTLGEVMGTVPHTGGTPTLWSFTAGNPSGYFAIDISGKITVTATGVAGLTAATYNLTCQATNGFGASSSMVTVILIPGGNTDPWINLDGRLNAPSGTPQYSTLLNNYPSASPPNARVRWPSLIGTQPPWQVAGVDYAVGIDNSVTLQDPWPGYPTATVAALAPALVTQAGGSSHISANSTSNTITFTGANNINISGWDFSLHGGLGITVTGTSTGAIIQNNNFVNASGQVFFSGFNQNQYTPILIDTGVKNVTIQNNVIDGNGIVNRGIGFGLIEFNGWGNSVIQYNWIKRAFCETMVLGNSPSGVSNILVQFNILENSGVGQSTGASPSGAHGDWVQIVSASVYSQLVGVTFSFNLLHQQSLQAGMATQGLSYNGNTGYFFSNDIMTNNTCVAASGSSMNSFFNADFSWLVGTGLISNNYMDRTGVSPQTAWWDVVSGTGGQPNTFTGTGNVDMLTGSVLSHP